MRNLGMHYFKNRAQAGRELAKQLSIYAKHNCAVVALNEGGVIIGAQIAMAIHANLMLLASIEINLPREDKSLGGMTAAGTLIYNPVWAEGEREEMLTEYHNYIEQQRLEKFHQLNTLVGKGGEIRRDLLARRVVILVADGLPDGFLLDMATDFLKPVALKKLVIAVPLASIQAVDRMHLLGDELHVLSVPENYMKTDHYYDDNDLPDQEGLFKVMENISLEWQNKPTPRK